MLAPTSQGDQDSVLPRCEEVRGEGDTVCCIEREKQVLGEKQSFAGRGFLFCFGWDYM